MFVGKRAGNFLLALTELFSLGRTTEALRAIIGSKSAISDFASTGLVDPKFQVEGVVPPTILFFQKTRLTDLSHSTTRNSSGDEIANVNFLYDDIVHAVKIQ